jgi:hypothetical protein
MAKSTKALLTGRIQKCKTNPSIAHIGLATREPNWLQGPLKACLTGRRQREEIEAPNAYGFGASAFRTCVPR